MFWHCVPSPWRKHFRSSPLRWSKIRTEPSSLPLITQLPCIADVIWRGTLMRMGWRKDCTQVGDSPGDTPEIAYESMPLTRLDIKSNFWSWEIVAYPLGMCVTKVQKICVATYVLVGISVTHFSPNGSRSYATLQLYQHQGYIRL